MSEGDERDPSAAPAPPAGGKRVPASPGSTSRADAEGHPDAGDVENGDIDELHRAVDEVLDAYERKRRLLWRRGP